MDPGAPARFRKAYAELREREGRGRAAELPELPYVREGPWAAQWKVRSRTFDGFVAKILAPMESARSVPLRVLDLGSGNGWLCYRLQQRGHASIALDWRYDDVDGLGAARGYSALMQPLFARVASSFENLPFPDRSCDLVVFNASLHYTTDLHGTLAEAARVLVPGGVVAILDSPFYGSESDGAAMVAEKRGGKTLPMGDAQTDLLAIPSIEFLTRGRLESASRELELSWRRHRVLYPLSYELRPLWARLRGRRTPSRFDVWEGRTVSAGADAERSRPPSPR
jgi:SAM-dependent methyltransferase